MFVIVRGSIASFPTDFTFRETDHASQTGDTLRGGVGENVLELRKLQGNLSWVLSVVIGMNPPKYIVTSLRMPPVNREFISEI